MTTRTIQVTDRERAAIEAGLRLIQNALDGEGLPPSIGRVFSNYGAHEGLNSSEIDDLIDRVVNCQEDER